MRRDELFLMNQRSADVFLVLPERPFAFEARPCPLPIPALRPPPRRPSPDERRGSISMAAQARAEGLFGDGRRAAKGGELLSLA